MTKINHINSSSNILIPQNKAAESQPLERVHYIQRFLLDVLKNTRLFKMIMFKR